MSRLSFYLTAGDPRSYKRQDKSCNLFVSVGKPSAPGEQCHR